MAKSTHLPLAFGPLDLGAPHKSSKLGWEDPVDKGEVGGSFAPLRVSEKMLIRRQHFSIEGLFAFFFLYPSLLSALPRRATESPRAEPMRKFKAEIDGGQMLCNMNPTSRLSPLFGRKFPGVLPYGEFSQALMKQMLPPGATSM